MEAYDPFVRNRPPSLAGWFVIAQTDLVDPNFFRTVVLITEHSSQGAFGLVVNRQLETTLGDVVPDLAGTHWASLPVYVGGPVGREYLFVLRRGEVHDSRPGTQPAPGLVFEPFTEQMVAYLKESRDAGEESPPSVHVYSGYSGWGAGQLDSELDKGSWFIHPAFADAVFSKDPETAWAKVLTGKGPLFEVIARTGYKPSLN